ncbi:hypothetical protein AB0E59_17045 [Lentzea sp. NPDC034063]|uniref:hypothetical protein n=1 Tax=unclassified Lentzea TaxID=2643253 RepID=UPI0033F150E8
MDRHKVDGYVYGGALTLVSLSVVPVVIAVAAGSRLWPFYLFVTFILISLMLLYRLLRGSSWSRAGATFAAAAGMTTVVLGALLVSYAIRGLPVNEADLARACTERTSHPGSAPLSADRRVTRVLMKTRDGFSHRPDFDLQPVEREWDLSTVQQVACLTRIGSNGLLTPCPYGYVPEAVAVTTTLYQGRWELEVREARTGQTIAIRGVDGSTDATCPSRTDVGAGVTGAIDYTEPSAADVQAALAQR